MPTLDIRDLTVNYAVKGGVLHALNEVNLAMRDGDFVVAQGASGCAKTTLLNCLAGFLPPSSGEILLDGRPVAGPGADRGVVDSRKETLGEEDQNDHQDQTVYQDIVFLDGMKQLRQNGQQNRAEGGSPEGAHPADQNHGDDLKGVEDAERPGADKGEVVGVKAAGQGSKDRAGHEDFDFKGLHIDPRAAGCDLFVAERGHGPARPGVNQVEGQEQDRAGNKPHQVINLDIRIEDPSSESEAGNPGESRRAAG